jgi:REP element-mobilizing transposase RayT
MYRDLPARHTTRLHDFNYSSNNLYYVTICTKNRECIFVGADYHPPEIIQLSKIGNIAKQCWEEIPNHYSFVSLNQFVIMPNHVHGIISIEHKMRADNNPPLHMVTGTVGAIVRGYKIGVTKWCRQNTNIYDVWQRNYYEHIIRDQKDLERIQKYIRSNPASWTKDRFYS